MPSLYGSKKTLALFLAVFHFTTSCLLASAPQTNLWTERHKKLELARLAAPALPRPSASVAAVSRLQIKRTHAPAKPTTGRILLINDIHRNAEAQKFISQGIAALIDKKEVRLLAVEGGFGPIDIAPFRSFPHPAALKLAADSLLTEFRIAGPLHGALTAASSIPVVGVDDPRLYDENVKAFQQASALKESVLKDLQKRERVLQDQKAKAFSKELLTLDALTAAYNQGEMGLGEYVQNLSRRPGLVRDAAIRTFLEAYELEKSLDFSKVESERQRLLSDLSQRISPTQAQTLLKDLTQLRNGALSAAAFHQKILAIASDVGISWDRFPLMETYIRYTRLADNIDTDQLLMDLRSTEEKIVASLVRTDEERALVRRTLHLALSKKLVEFALTPAEWNEYLKGVPSAWYLVPSQELGSRHQELGTSLKPFENFYRLAHARDEAMFKNLLKAVPSAQFLVPSRGNPSLGTRHRALGTPSVILVTGGFHSKGLIQRLTQAGFSVSEAIPAITQVDTESGGSYLNAFLREKTPLEKLYQRDRLFLSEKVQTPDRRLELAAATAVTGFALGLNFNPLPWFRRMAGTARFQLRLPPTPSLKFAGDIYDSLTRRAAPFQFSAATARDGRQADPINLTFADPVRPLWEEVLYAFVLLEMPRLLLGLDQNFAALTPLILVGLYLYSSLQFALDHKEINIFNSRTGLFAYQREATWKDKIYFGALGGLFRVGYLLSISNPAWAPAALPIALAAHWLYSNTVAPALGLPQAATGNRTFPPMPDRPVKIKWEGNFPEGFKELMTTYLRTANLGYTFAIRSGDSDEVEVLNTMMVITLRERNIQAPHTWEGIIGYMDRSLFPPRESRPFFILFPMIREGLRQLLESGGTNYDGFEMIRIRLEEEGLSGGWYEGLKIIKGGLSQAINLMTPEQINSEEGRSIIVAGLNKIFFRPAGHYITSGDTSSPQKTIETMSFAAVTNDEQTITVEGKNYPLVELNPYTLTHYVSGMWYTHRPAEFVVIPTLVAHLMRYIHNENISSTPFTTPKAHLGHIYFHLFRWLDSLYPIEIYSRNALRSVAYDPLWTVQDPAEVTQYLKEGQLKSSKLNPQIMQRVINEFAAIKFGNDPFLSIERMLAGALSTPNPFNSSGLVTFYLMAQQLHRGLPPFSQQVMAQLKPEDWVTITGFIFNESNHVSLHQAVDRVIENEFQNLPSIKFPFPADEDSFIRNISVRQPQMTIDYLQRMERLVADLKNAAPLPDTPPATLDTAGQAFSVALHIPMALGLALASDLNDLTPLKEIRVSDLSPEMKEKWNGVIDRIQASMPNAPKEQVNRLIYVYDEINRLWFAEHGVYLYQETSFDIRKFLNPATFRYFKIIEGITLPPSPFTPDRPGPRLYAVQLTGGPALNLTAWSPTGFSGVNLLDFDKEKRRTGEINNQTQISKLMDIGPAHNPLGRISDSLLRLIRTRDGAKGQIQVLSILNISQSLKFYLFKDVGSRAGVSLPGDVSQERLDRISDYFLKDDSLWARLLSQEKAATSKEQFVDIIIRAAALHAALIRAENTDAALAQWASELIDTKNIHARCLVVLMEALLTDRSLEGMRREDIDRMSDSELADRMWTLVETPREELQEALVSLFDNEYQMTLPDIEYPFEQLLPQQIQDIIRSRFSPDQLFIEWDPKIPESMRPAIAQNLKDLKVGHWFKVEVGSGKPIDFRTNFVNITLPPSALSSGRPPRMVNPYPKDSDLFVILPALQEALLTLHGSRGADYSGFRALRRRLLEENLTGGIFDQLMNVEAHVREILESFPDGQRQIFGNPLFLPAINRRIFVPNNYMMGFVQLSGPSGNTQSILLSRLIEPLYEMKAGETSVPIHIVEQVGGEVQLPKSTQLNPQSIILMPAQVENEIKGFLETPAKPGYGEPKNEMTQLSKKYSQWNRKRFGKNYSRAWLNTVARIRGSDLGYNQTAGGNMTAEKFVQSHLNEGELKTIYEAVPENAFGKAKPETRGFIKGAAPFFQAVAQGADPVMVLDYLFTQMVGNETYRAHSSSAHLVIYLLLRQLTPDLPALSALEIARFNTNFENFRTICRYLLEKHSAAQLDNAFKEIAAREFKFPDVTFNLKPDHEYREKENASLPSFGKDEVTLRQVRAIFESTKKTLTGAPIPPVGERGKKKAATGASGYDATPPSDATASSANDDWRWNGIPKLLRPSIERFMKEIAVADDFRVRRADRKGRALSLEYIPAVKDGRPAHVDIILPNELIDADLAARKGSLLKAALRDDQDGPLIDELRKRVPKLQTNKYELFLPSFQRALKVVREKTFDDFTPLLDLADQLPQVDRGAWTKTVNEIKTELDDRTGINVMSDLYQKMVQRLNDRWFAPHDVVLYTTHGTDYGDAASASSIHVATLIQNDGVLHLHDRDATIYRARSTKPITEDRAIQNYQDNMLLGFPDVIEEDLKNLEQTAYSSYRILVKLALKGIAPNGFYEVRLFKKIGEAMVDKVTTFFGRPQGELDAYMTEGNYPATLRAELCKVFFAQLYAGIASPYPNASVLEVLINPDKNDASKRKWAVRHLLVNLLAKKLNIAVPETIASDEELPRIVEEVASTPPAQLRYAMVQLYREEFALPLLTFDMTPDGRFVNGHGLPIANVTFPADAGAQLSFRSQAGLFDFLDRSKLADNYRLEIGEKVRVGYDAGGAVITVTRQLIQQENTFWKQNNPSGDSPITAEIKKRVHRLQEQKHLLFMEPLQESLKAIHAIGLKDLEPLRHIGGFLPAVDRPAWIQMVNQVEGKVRHLLDGENQSLEIVYQHCIQGLNDLWFEPRDLYLIPPGLDYYPEPTGSPLGLARILKKAGNLNLDDRKGRLYWVDPIQVPEDITNSVLIVNGRVGLIFYKNAKSYPPDLFDNPHLGIPSGRMKELKPQLLLDYPLQAFLLAAYDLIGSQFFESEGGGSLVGSQGLVHLSQNGADVLLRPEGRLASIFKDNPNQGHIVLRVLSFLALGASFPTPITILMDVSLRLMLKGSATKTLKLLYFLIADYYGVWDRPVTYQSIIGLTPSDVQEIHAKLPRMPEKSELNDMFKAIFDRESQTSTGPSFTARPEGDYWVLGDKPAEGGTAPTGPPHLADKPTGDTKTPSTTTPSEDKPTDSDTTPPGTTTTDVPSASDPETKSETDTPEDTSPQKPTGPTNADRAGIIDLLHEGSRGDIDVEKWRDILLSLELSPEDFDLTPEQAIEFYWTEDVCAGIRARMPSLAVIARLAGAPGAQRWNPDTLIAAVAAERRTTVKAVEGWFQKFFTELLNQNKNNFIGSAAALAAVDPEFPADFDEAAARSFFLSSPLFESSYYRQPGDEDMKDLIQRHGLSEQKIATERKVAVKMARGWLIAFVIQHRDRQGRPHLMALLPGLTLELVNAWLDNDAALKAEALRARSVRPSDQKLMASIEKNDGRLSKVAEDFDVELAIVYRWVYDQPAESQFMKDFRAYSPGQEIIRFWLADFMGDIQAAAEAHRIKPEDLEGWMTPADHQLAAALRQLNATGMNLLTLVGLIESNTTLLSEEDRQDIITWLKRYFPTLLKSEKIEEGLVKTLPSMDRQSDERRYVTLDDAYTIAHFSVMGQDSRSLQSAHEVVPFSIRLRLSNDYPHMKLTHLFVRGAYQTELRMKDEGDGFYSAEGTLLLPRRHNGDINTLEFFAVDGVTSPGEYLRGRGRKVTIEYTGRSLTRAGAKAHMAFLRERLVVQTTSDRGLRVERLRDTIERILMGDFTEDTKAGFDHLDGLIEFSRVQLRSQLAARRLIPHNTENEDTLAQFLNQLVLNPDVEAPPADWIHRPVNVLLLQAPELISTVDSIRILLDIRRKFRDNNDVVLPPLRSGEERAFPRKSAVLELLERHRNFRGSVFHSPWDMDVVSDLAATVAQRSPQTTMIVLDRHLIDEFRKAHAQLANPPAVVDLVSGSLSERNERLQKLTQTDENAPRVVLISPETLEEYGPRDVDAKKKKTVSDADREAGWNYMHENLGLLVVMGGHQLGAERAKFPALLRDLSDRSSITRIAVTNVASQFGIPPLMQLLNFVDSNIVSSGVSAKETEFDRTNPAHLRALHELVNRCVVMYEAERLYSSPNDAAAAERLPRVLEDALTHTVTHNQMADLFLYFANTLMERYAGRHFSKESRLIRLFNREEDGVRAKEKELVELVQRNPTGRFLIFVRHKEDVDSIRARVPDPHIVTTDRLFGDQGDPRLEGVTHIVYFDPPRNTHDLQAATFHLKPVSGGAEIHVIHLSAEYNSSWFHLAEISLPPLARLALLGTRSYEEDRYRKIHQMMTFMNRLVRLYKEHAETDKSQTSAAPGDKEETEDEKILRIIQELLEELNDPAPQPALPTDEAEPTEKREATAREVFDVIQSNILETLRAENHLVSHRHDWNDLAYEDALTELAGAELSASQGPNDTLLPHGAVVQSPTRTPGEVITEFKLFRKKAKAPKKKKEEAAQKPEESGTEGKQEPVWKRAISVSNGILLVDNQPMTEWADIQAALKAAHAAGDVSLLRQWAWRLYSIRALSGTADEKHDWLRQSLKAMAPERLAKTPVNTTDLIESIAEEHRHWFFPLLENLYRRHNPSAPGLEESEEPVHPTVAKWFMTRTSDVWANGDVDTFIRHVILLHKRFTAYVKRYGLPALMVSATLGAWSFLDNTAGAQEIGRRAVDYATQQTVEIGLGEILWAIVHDNMWIAGPILFGLSLFIIYQVMAAGLAPITVEEHIANGNSRHLEKHPHLITPEAILLMAQRLTDIRDRVFVETERKVIIRILSSQPALGLWNSAFLAAKKQPKKQVMVARVIEKEIQASLGKKNPGLFNQQIERLLAADNLRDLNRAVTSKEALAILESIHLDRTTPGFISHPILTMGLLVALAFFVLPSSVLPGALTVLAIAFPVYLLVALLSGSGKGTRTLMMLLALSLPGVFADRSEASTAPSASAVPMSPSDLGVRYLGSALPAFGGDRHIVLPADASDQKTLERLVLATASYRRVYLVVDGNQSPNLQALPTEARQRVETIRHQGSEPLFLSQGRERVLALAGLDNDIQAIAQRHHLEATSLLLALPESVIPDGRGLSRVSALLKQLELWVFQGADRAVRIAEKIEEFEALAFTKRHA